MAPSGKEAFKYVSLEMPRIIEASIARARNFGHTQVTPLHVIERMIDIPSGMICGDRGSCPECNTLRRFITTAFTRLLFTSRSEPSLSDELVVSIRSAVDSFRGRSCFQLEDVKKLFVLLLDDPKVRNAVEEAGFSISVIKNNVENGGTLCKCRVEEKKVKKVKTA